MCKIKMTGISFAMILITIFLLKLPSAYGVPCNIATNTTSLLQSKLNNADSCDKVDGRNLIQLNATDTIKLESPITLFKDNIHFKNIGSTSLFTFSNASDFLDIEYFAPWPFESQCSIIVEGSNNIIEGINIAGRGICLGNTTNQLIKNTVNTIKAGSSGDPYDYGLYLTNSAKSEAVSEAWTLPNSTKIYPSILKLLCSNTVSGGGKQTNLDLNANGIDDYQDIHNQTGWQLNCLKAYAFITFLEKDAKALCATGGGTYTIDSATNFPKCDCPVGLGWNKEGGCTVCSNHQILKYGLCIDCGADEISKNGACVKCAGNEIMQNNKCTACAEDEVVTNGACAKCAADEAIKNFQCAKTACDPTSETENTDGTCSCKADFGRYLALPDMPCVECGSGKQVISGGVETCECSKNYHHEIDGSCVPNSVAGCEVVNAVQVKEEGGDCYCKDGYGIKVYNGNVITCEETGLCSDPAKFEWDSVTKICLSISCNQGEKVNLTTGLCEPDGSSPAAGDCGCNFGSSSVNMAQSALPYLAVALGGIGIAIWRRKKI